VALDGRNYPPGTPVFTFVAPDGANTHVDAEKLREWCTAHRAELEVVDTPVNFKLGLSFLIENVIDLAHAERVMRMEKLDPIIYGVTGTGKNGRPDVILIDGHHRYFCAAVMGCKWIPSFVLAPFAWREFEIIGLPSVSEDQLRRMPTTKGRKHAKM
jgi:hypothetical protein